MVVRTGGRAAAHAAARRRPYNRKQSSKRLEPIGSTVWENSDEYHYHSRRIGHAPLRQRFPEIAASRVRYVYRRNYVLLRREAGQ